MVPGMAQSISYVDAAGGTINWGSAVTSGAAQVDIYQVIADDQHSNTLLWARAGQTVPAARVAAAQADTFPAGGRARTGILTSSADVVNAGAGVAYRYLPTGAASGTVRGVQNNGEGAIYVDPTGTDTIDGGTAPTTVPAGAVAQFQSNGAGAWVRLVAANSLLNATYASKAGPNVFTGTQDFTGATVTGVAGGGGAASLLDRGNWATTTVYAVGDVITQAGQRYACRTAHTAGTFATDLTASKWVTLDAVTAAASDLSNVTPSAGRTALGLGTLATQSPTGSASGSTFLRGDGSWASPSSLPGYFDIRNYGAKVDGRVVFDAVTTNSSTTITSATAAFTSGDVGKAIVVRGVGSSGAELVTTISSVTNSTTVVVANSASASSSSLLATIATDDTAAVQAALAAAVAAGGGTVYHPGGICLLTGAPQTGTVAGASYSYAGVLNIPARLRTAGQSTIRFLGATPPPMMFYGVYTSEAIQPESGCAVYQFTATSGNGVDAIPNAAADALGNYYTSYQFRSESLLWRFPNNPQCGGLKLLQCSDASLKDSAVTVNASANVMLTPTGSGVALTLPKVQNNGLSEARNVNVYGFPTGIVHNEHTVLDNVYVTWCGVGVAPGAGPHLSVYPSLYVAQCGSMIKATGDCSISGLASFEPKTNGGPTYKCDVDDYLGYLHGELGLISNGGQYVPTVNGGLNLNVRRIWKIAIPPSQFTTAAPATVFDVSAPNAASGLPMLDTGQTWHNANGNWGMSSGFAVCPSGGYAMVKSLNGTTPTVTMNLTTASGTSAIGAVILGDRAATNQFTAMIHHGNAAQILKNGTAVANSGTISYTANAAHALVVDYGVTTPGTITAKLDGSTVVTYALSGPEQTAYVGNLYVGMFTFAGVDTGSKVGSFSTV